MTILDLTVTLTLLGLLATAAAPLFSDLTLRARVNRAIGEISRVSIEIENWRIQTDAAMLPDSLAAAGIQINTDPWGNPYTYVRSAGTPYGDRRTDGRLTLVNSDFDLYSNGPDGMTEPSFGATSAQDDIVRARNGAFVGVAKNY